MDSIFLVPKVFPASSRTNKVEPQVVLIEIFLLYGDCDIKNCSDPQNPILPLRTQQVSCLHQLILPFRMKGVMATGNRKKKLEQMSFPNEKNRNLLSLSMIIGMILI